MRNLANEVYLGALPGADCRSPNAEAARFPAGSRAVIWKQDRSVTSSAPQRQRPWRLKFERRSPQTIEPLMGWTSDADPLAQVQLSFPSREAAVAYAERQGLDYRVRDSDGEGFGSAFSELAWRNAALNSLSDRHSEALSAKLDRAMVDPAAVFGSPAEVVTHPDLGYLQKHEILRRWAWDEYLLEIAADEAMVASDSGSRLAEVKAALNQLEELARAYTALAWSPAEQEKAGR